MKRKIYFAGSIRGGRDDQKLYYQLICYLLKYGQVLTEHVGDSIISGAGEETLPDEAIFQRDVCWIRAADVVIAEVTTPSIGVGYEIAVADGMNKPIFCLYRDTENKKLSAMISGNPRLEIARYITLKDAIKHIDSFFKTMDERI